MTPKQKQDADLIRKMQAAIHAVSFRSLKQNEQKLVLETAQEAVERQIRSKSPVVF